MKIKKFISSLFILVLKLNSKSAYDEYKKLKINDSPSITYDDLPNEFSRDAFKTIDEFIRKTKYLDYECLLYFDYITGKILKCAFGNSDNVKLDYNDVEFEGHHVASIHNHTKDVFSPPSGKNFGILERSFDVWQSIVKIY